MCLSTSQKKRKELMMSLRQKSTVEPSILMKVFSTVLASLSQITFSPRDYDNAIKYAEKINPINQSAVSTLQRAYGAKGMKDKAFEVGARLFLETYVTTPATAMRVITSMMNQVPDNYDDA